MPRTMSHFALAVGLGLIATPAHAEWMSGNELYDMCSTASVVDRASCLAYVMGVLDGVRGLDQPPRTPVGATGGQVRDVVTKYLADHPESRTLPARKIVTSAVIDAWPALQPKPKAKPKAKPAKKR